MKFALSIVGLLWIASDISMIWAHMYFPDFKSGQAVLYLVSYLPTIPLCALLAKKIADDK